MSRRIDVKDREVRLPLRSAENIRTLFGYLDSKIKIIESVFEVEIDIEEEDLVIRTKGDRGEALLARDFLQELSYFSPQEELSSRDLQKMAVSFKENKKAWWNDKAGSVI